MQTISNIEKINDFFHLPISYNLEKMELNKNIIEDLELTSSVDPSSNSLYQFAFQPQTLLGEKVLEQIPKYYTTDKLFLKDTQTIIKTNAINLNTFSKEELSEIMEMWDEIKNDNGFKEKYNYIDWPMWEHLNKSESFLQILSIYNLASPIISFIIPFLFLIIPFFIIKAKGIKITTQEYGKILYEIASNHAIGKVFTQFNKVKLDEKIYLLLSAAFYLFSIYQNILTCYRFQANMKKIHTYIKTLKVYIKTIMLTMSNWLLITQHLKSYDNFNTNLIEKYEKFVKIERELIKITDYENLYSCKTKVMELGHILKCFYAINNDSEYNDTFMYSFGFVGYLDNLQGLIVNLQQGKINCSTFTNKIKKTKFCKSYYPALIDKNPVKNTITMKKNVIITGPNASGKTTILKSALINVIITQQFGCGFYESASIKPYKYIHCYLNIPDTSGRDSLYQAESRRCKDILDIITESDKKDEHFCVFDELYSGTNPEEAVLSAYAFLTFLVKYKNVNCMLSTHFKELCFKLNNNIKIENYQMITERKGDDDFNYTFLFVKGISDISGGIKVLKDMNYPDEIIQNAK